MIGSNQELAASLQYMQHWADLLEGMRQTAQQTNDTMLLPVTTAGPISEIRRVLSEASAYIEGVGEPTEAENPLSLNGNREKAA